MMAKSHFMTYELDLLQAVLFLMAISCSSKVDNDETPLSECHVQCHGTIALQSCRVQHLQLFRCVRACSWRCGFSDSTNCKCAKGMRWKRQRL